jgi:large subunit ribosomal protein L19e
MGGLLLQKKLAADILKVGQSRVVMNPEHLEDIKNAITRRDIKKIISKGYIKVKRSKIKMPDLYHKKRKKGPGSKKGSSHAKLTKKEKWMHTVRPLRRMLKELRDKGSLDTKTYRKTYMLIKSGMFRSRSHLKLYLKQKGVLSEDRTKV